MTLCLMACSPPPPVISADLSCIWTKPLDVTQFQVAQMKADPGTWRPLALQIADHNAERKLRCDKS